MNIRLLPCILVGLMFITFTAHSAVIGQTDDFEDGSLENWGVGGPSSIKPQNIADGGPLGDSDNYLRISSSGQGGPGSRLVVFNDAMQWKGNYKTNGITKIAVDLANFGDQALDIRLALGGLGNPNPNRPNPASWVSSNSITIPTGGQWQRVIFDISASDVTQVGGGEPIAAILGEVDKLRILAGSAPGFQGDVLTGTIGIDNVTAAPLPAAVWFFVIGIVTMFGGHKLSFKT